MGVSETNSCVAGIQLFFYQLAALLYKNVMLGLRLWRTTLCHLLLPCLMIIIFGIVTTATANTGEVRVSAAFAEFNSAESTVSGGLPTCRVFDTVGGRYGLGAPIPNYPCVTLAYAPNNVSEVNTVMAKVAQLNGLTFSQTPSSTAPLPGVMGFSSADVLTSFATANPGMIGHGVVFPASFIVNVNESAHLNSAASIPTIPIEVLFNKSAIGQFYAGTGDDLLFGQASIASTPLKVHRAVVEAILALHTGATDPEVAFDIRQFPQTSNRDASSSLDNLVGIFVYLGVMIPFVLTIRHVVAEKENNILDAMRMTGLRESAYWLSWFIYFAFTSLISTALMYFAGIGMNTPIFVYVDGSILFAVLYCYFLATLCLALMLSAFIPSTRVAVMVGFCLLALGVVAQALFSIAPFISTLVYDPFILPTPGLRALNLYPPIVLARITSDMSSTILPYIPEGANVSTRNRYTRQDFQDGFYRYGAPERPDQNFMANLSSCILNPSDKASPLAKCNTYSTNCPLLPGNIFTTNCPQVPCTDSWAKANNASVSACTNVGGMLVDGLCKCRWINDSDEQNLNTLVGLMFLFLILAWYLGQVFTCGHGRAEPCYFFMLPWYWIPSLKPRGDYGGTFGVAKDSDVLAMEEKIRSGAAGGSVVVHGLRKKFGSTFGPGFTAVNGLSFAMEQGKCFALLGHNGAGKTTAIKMLNGLISISDGDVIVDGRSVRQNVSSIRKDIGACPQHDILWPELSAYQHLKFFGIFQGMSNLENSVQDMLVAVRLNREGSNPSSSFSGGMKRRLSVAIASLGNKKVVILDEPTTGMDPQNRSHVWKMIAELKKDRVVLLTTHSMEEAEYLGDDIGIMSHGHLIALGTTLKLKSKFGGGYRLKLVVGNSSSAKEIRDAVTRYVPDAVLIDQSAGDLAYDLPGSADRQLPELFRWIEGQQGALNDWAVSQVSLEDIFIRLTKDSMPENERKAAGAPATAMPTVTAKDKNVADAVVVDATGGGNDADMEAQVVAAEEVDMSAGSRSWLSSYISQFRGIFLKTGSLFKRNKWTMCCQLILPLGLIAVIFGIKYAVESTTSQFALSSGVVGQCESCMSSMTQTYIADLAQFTQCGQDNPGFIQQNCGFIGSGIFMFKNATLSQFGEQAWTDWLVHFASPPQPFKFDVAKDLVPTNPVYAFCVVAQFISSTCAAYADVLAGASVNEPATYFGTNPMGPSTNSPLRVMVAAPAGLDVGSNCVNNSNLLLRPTTNKTSTFAGDNNQILSQVSVCTSFYFSNGAQTPYNSFPRSSGEQVKQLNSGEDLSGTCNITIADIESFTAALQLTQTAGTGLMSFFPVDVVEGSRVSPTSSLFVVWANVSELALTPQQIYGTDNMTAVCSSFFFTNAINSLPFCDANCFTSTIQNARQFSSSTLQDEYGRFISIAKFRLDACLMDRSALMQSPALCALDSFADIKAKHLDPSVDVQTRVDSYVFDMQDLAKSQLGFAQKPFARSLEGQFQAREAVLNHFPDAALVFKEFNASRARVRFSLQSYFENFGYSNGGIDYGHASVLIKRCVGDEAALLQADPNNFDSKQCAEKPDLTNSFSPGFRVPSYNRQWGRSLSGYSASRVCGEETFVFSGVATAALRYATTNGLRVPSSPVGTDPTTQFMLGVKPFPYPRSASGSTIFDISIMINLMVDLLVPFATTMLWPVFVYSFVHEKELKLRAMQTMMGMRADCYFLVNYVFDFLMAFTMLVLIYICGFFMSIPFFSHNEGALVILLFWIWANTLVGLTFFFQTFLSRTRTSSIITYLLLLGSVIGSFLANFLAFTSTFIPAPPAFLIWPPFVFYRAISVMNKRAFFLADLTLQDELGRLIGVLVIETIVLFVVSLYLDLVIPREYGRPRHPLFFIIDPYRAWKRSSKQRVEDDGAQEQLPVVVLKGEEDVAPEKDDKDQEAEDPDVAAERVLVESRNYTKPPAVEVLHLRKVYASGKVAVEDVTMHMETGEVFCLLGPNGAGKSTVIGVLTGLFALSKGKAAVNGFDVMTEMYRVYERLGVTPQFDTLWPSLTVTEHLLYYARIKGVPRRDEMKYVLKAATAVRLNNAMNKKSRQLSGGMRRRLSLAISLVGNPLTIFLDEPTTGLDPETRRQIWQLIESEKRERCIVLTTHSMEEAEALSNRVAIMAHGLLKTVGTTMQLKNKFGDGYRIQVSFRQGNESLADDFVRKAIPRAELAESRMGLRTYKVARDQGKVSDIFETFLSRDVETSGVEDWGIEQSTLEQVFLKIAAESERVYGTA